MAVGESPRCESQVARLIAGKFSGPPIKKWRRPLAAARSVDIGESLIRAARVHENLPCASYVCAQHCKTNWFPRALPARRS